MESKDSVKRLPEAPAASVATFASSPRGTAHPLPSKGTPLETQFDVLRRFMAVSRNGAEPVAPVSVDGPGLPPGAAQGNAPFLGDIGLLVEEMPGRFKPTPVAMQLINTWLGDEGRGRRLLKSLIEKTWFGRAARSYIDTRGGSPLEEEGLARALAAAAGVVLIADPGALLTLTQYLAFAGLWPLTPCPPPPPPKHLQSAPDSAVPERSEERGLPSSNDATDWEEIRTNEFSLKIRPAPAAVKRLRKQLDLLDERLKESPKSKARR
jgi:hypothetical protein